MLFVPSMVADSVTAYDTSTGEQRWRFYTDGPIRLAPVSGGGRVFFGSDDGHLYCVDANTGKQIWRARGGPSDRKVLGNERLISTWPVRGGPVLHEGRIYRESVKYSKGTPHNPFKLEELKDKFKTLASSLFSETRIGVIIEAVESLDELDDISELTALLKEE